MAFKVDSLAQPETIPENGEDADEAPNKKILTVKPPLPVYFGELPMMDPFKRNSTGYHIEVKLHENCIKTFCYRKPNDMFNSLQSNVWLLDKNDIEVFRMCLIFDKNNEPSILLQYCYDRNVLKSDKFSHSLGSLYPLPVDKKIDLPYIDMNNIIIDTGDMINTIDKDSKLTQLVSIKLCDVKNISKCGPMLVVETSDINYEHKRKYCKKIDIVKDGEIDLFQVIGWSNKSMIFNFPYHREKKKCEPKIENNKVTWLKNRVLDYWYVYYIIFVSILFYFLLG